MRVYHAAIYTNKLGISGATYQGLSDGGKYDMYYIDNILESYHYIKHGNIADTIRRDGRKVFLDSGAFSDWTSGKQTDLKAYSEFIKRNADIIECASVLDAIGDAHATYENQIELEALGCNVLPCFHYGDDIQYLEYYMANYDHITIGGMVGAGSGNLKLWLDVLWDEYLTDETGKPKLKVHGFGLTAKALIERYPWYSVDSSVWVQASRVGELCFPHLPRVQVSSKSDYRKDENKHLWTLAEPVRENIEQYIRSRGYQPEELSDRYQERWAFNCGTYNKINKQYENKEAIFIPDQTVLFTC